MSICAPDDGAVFARIGKPVVLSVLTLRLADRAALLIGEMSTM